MSKLTIVTAMSAVTLGLAACGGGAENNMAAENLEDLNAAEDMNMDMGNLDMNMDMNAADNTVDNATGNAASAETNETNSY